jgi:D-alanyl-D-alanine carboxypeptidase
VIGFLRFYIVILILLGAPPNTLVDKEHALPVWYSPGVSIEAESALDQLIQNFGHEVDIVSDFRSYRDQVEAYNRLVAKEGQARADQVIARPGHSEHQLGTTFDVAWAGLPVEFLDPRNEQLWDYLYEYAHEYGFIISFPLKRIDDWPYDNKWYPVVTQFRWEPWHIRYVGVELASTIYQAGYLDPESEVLPQDFYQVWLE